MACRDSDTDQCASGISTSSAPTLLCNSTSKSSGKTQGDDKTVPPEPPQRSSSEALNEKYKKLSIPSAEWRTPPTSQSSSSASCSSRETSEQRHLPQKSQSARDPPSNDRYTVKWSDTTTEIPVKSNSEHQLHRSDYASITKKEKKEINTNHTAIGTSGNCRTAAPTFKPCSQNVEKRKEPTMEVDTRMNGIPPELPKTAWSDLPPSPRQCPRHPGRGGGGQADTARKDYKSIRFGLTKSAENVYSTTSARPTVNGRVPAGGQVPAAEITMSQSHCEGVTTPDDGVTLRFRRYKLTSTPETTV
ncbi:hypothetical protein NECAME_10932 [Necator americanus]|uniref:Uncharacterized protein n=1 Tax=Necator americanus TaxID=51031 RepID=W2T6R8_NECAM|nr:hypothetical protein NECAME_10932 [Necator americanus]ETN77583.1 hypothetical protein NECAME_10932 [Necator americanus]